MRIYLSTVLIIGMPKDAAVHLVREDYHLAVAVRTLEEHRIVRGSGILFFTFFIKIGHIIYYRQKKLSMAVKYSIKIQTHYQL